MGKHVYWGVYIFGHQGKYPDVLVSANTSDVLVANLAKPLDLPLVATVDCKQRVSLVLSIIHFDDFVVGSVQEIVF